MSTVANYECAIARPWPATDGEPLRNEDALLWKLPILPGTQFLLEWELGRDAPDLARLTGILLRDPAAVLHLFALAATVAFAATAPPRRPSAGDAGLRVEDLVLALGKEDLLHGLCRQVPAHGDQARTLQGFAARAREVAAMCGTVAEATGLPCDQAYLVGLLSDTVNLAGQLGRPWPSGTWPQAGMHSLCSRYALPPALRQALCEIADEDACSPWKALVDAAFELLRSGQACYRAKPGGRTACS